MHRVPLEKLLRCCSLSCCFVVYSRQLCFVNFTHLLSSSRCLGRGGVLEFGISPFVIVQCSDSPDYVYILYLHHRPSSLCRLPPCRRHSIKHRSPAPTNRTIYKSFAEAHIQIHVTGIN